MSLLSTARQDLRALRHDPVAWVCLPFLIAGCALPFVNVGAAPFWADESIAVLPAHNIHKDLLPTSPYDIDFMPWQLKHGLWDPATPLYRYSVAAFTAVTGFSEFTARSFSVLMGLLWVFPLYALVRKLDGRRMALLTVTFLVSSTTFMVFAREARHFTFLGCMVLCTLYFLYTATEGREDRSRALWVVFLVATLLTQTLGYGILPVVGLYVLVNGGPSRFLAWRHLPVYVAVGAAYLAVMWEFWETLPFFHDVSCATRSECRPMWWFYLAVLYAFLSPLTDRLEAGPIGLSPIPIIFVIGLVVTIRAVRARRVPREKASLLLIWFLVPLVMLTAQDLKFDRYLFVWSMPLCALFTAYGVRRLLRTRRLRTRPTAAAIALVLIVTLSPQLIVERPGGPPVIHSAFLSYVSGGLFHAEDDNWERIRWQANLLREEMRPGDVVVSTMDDASLQYYLGQFVYGFLNSRRSDQFFLDLLDQAERSGTRVWLIDTLPQWNFCLAGEPEPWRIDCRTKYAGFYLRCKNAGNDGKTACRRLPIQ